MSSSGSVQLVNVQTKPILISLATKQGRQTDSTLSDVTWSMQESIGVIDQNFTAVISLASMVFSNAFKNITEANNKLKIVSTYTVAGVVTLDTINVVIPIGNYSNVTMRDTLNATVSATVHTCSKFLTPYYYGLAFNTSPFITDPSDPAALRIIFPTAGDGGDLGVVATAHLYTGFFLQIDAETEGLMSTLGLLDKNQSGEVTNAVAFQNAAGTQFKGIGAKVYNTGVSQPYTYLASNAVPTAIETYYYDSGENADFGGPTALCIQWESVYAGTRNSFDQLSSGDTIAVVPIDGAYGIRNVYEPANPFKCVVPNFNVNQFHILVKNADTGEKVDFEGNHWLITIMIEFYEIDNGYKSATAEAGVGRVIMPTSHSTVYDHTLPYSGMGNHRQAIQHQSKRGRY